MVENVSVKASSDASVIVHFTLNCGYDRSLKPITVPYTPKFPFTTILKNYDNNLILKLTNLVPGTICKIVRDPVLSNNKVKLFCEDFDMYASNIESIAAVNKKLIFNYLKKTGLLTGLLVLLPGASIILGHFLPKVLKVVPGIETIGVLPNISIDKSMLFSLMKGFGVAGLGIGTFLSTQYMITDGKQVYKNIKRLLIDKTVAKTNYFKKLISGKKYTQNAKRSVVLIILRRQLEQVVGQDELLEEFEAEEFSAIEEEHSADYVVK